jgi:hypothetical protein
MSNNTHKFTIEQFLAHEESPQVKALVGKFNGGAFMCCHTQYFAETGIWIEELVPVFQKIDATLAVNNQRKVSVLSPRFSQESPVAF